MEKLRWELEKDLTTDDKLLILSVCDNCEQKTLSLNRPESWTEADKRFDFAWKYNQKIFREIQTQASPNVKRLIFENSIKRQ